MKNEELVKSWLEFANMDANLASFSFANMYPKPLELICYHCQQAAEKALKALIIASADEAEVPKTHDLPYLSDILSEKYEITDALYNACSDLNPYGVKIRYPKQIPIDDELTKKALSDQKKIVDWVKETIEKCDEAKEANKDDGKIMCN